ncbi:purine-nucleoside phosphorylase [Nannocystis pusilla]|uniref:purine-nucleoside phosphorylase n=1 Tax=Nannocystis pusilla TaxID=889268 RepID=A0ABS7TTH0_9BACT|nr:purine-nucleoside phosphorylase [Nannocystis pusilla]MBZ5711516.1 purine-nucleoside phosphorylase [Nannocystis pusilla]
MLHTEDPHHHRASELLRERLEGATIDWVVVSGSGFVGIAGEGPDGLGMAIEGSIPLRGLGLPVPTVAGHGNALVFGTIGELRVCVQTGRIHPYEGHPIDVCTAPLFAMLANGARGVCLTCAVGGLDPTLRTGQVVLLKDQMNLFGPTPLVGPRFIDMSQLYSPHLRARLQALDPGLGAGKLAEVVYAHARGPQYETPAETAALRTLGGQVVGMSTTYEAILAAAHGAAVCGVGVVTNAASQVGLSHDEVQVRTRAARPQVAALLRGLLAQSPVS